jgi:hypothetical protein
MIPNFRNGASALAFILRAVRSNARIIAALLIVLPAVSFTASALWKSVHAPFGRDQGIFQYVAWALTKGERDYVDFREINGPLIHIIHLIFYKLGGGDEYVFRCFDVALTSIVYFGVGLALPGLGWKHGDAIVRPSATTRIAWGAASWVVLSGYYLLFHWWDHAQREGFYNLFIMSSMALQLQGQLPSGHGPKVRRAFFVLAGAASSIPWFGKPTCVIFTAAQLLGIFLDKDSPERRVVAMSYFSAGCVLGAVPMVAFVVIFGDVGAYLRILLFEVPRIYGYIWPKTMAESYEAWGNAPRLNYGFATAAVATLLSALGVTPRRFLPMTFFLLGAIVTFFLQAKGFPYHLHPIVAAYHLVWLGLVVVVVERATVSRVRFALVASGSAAALVGYQVTEEARLCSSANPIWYEHAKTAADRLEKLPQDFNGWDYYAWDIRRAAAFARAATPSDDRIQMYAMDPYFLFLAERLSASPYIYGFELNVDSALLGGRARKPSERDRAWLVETAKRHEREMLGALERRPPAAFVFIDNQPFSYPQDAAADFVTHCPDAYAWARSRYTPSRQFGKVRIWLRNDLIDAAAHIPEST